MPRAHQCPVFEYRRCADQDEDRPARHPVVVVGGGPVGLTAALDLTRHGVPVVLLDHKRTVCDGSRAICFAKRTLEIFDRLGCAQPLVDKGVTWNLGRVFLGDREVYNFNLLPESDHHRPAFINLQQYYVEEFILERLRAERGADLRWCNRVAAAEPGADGVRVRVETPEGGYDLIADYLIVADGARSPVRHMLGLKSEGQVFRDRFLIADVVMTADFPTERWFWFNPPFHQGQSTLLHRQADNVFRIDFQLGWDADPEEECKSERVRPRIEAMLGAGAEFELEWVSVYSFQCRRMASFHPYPRVFFAGDAAHQVSPFGARGANSGIQDIDNLVWKLALVLSGEAPEALLASYDAERGPAADENILNSTRSTDFITPKSEASRAFRDATLMLARNYPFARRLVNSGRLSVPTILRSSALNTADTAAFEGAMTPGAPAVDAPVETETGAEWLLGQLGGGFTGLYFGGPADAGALADSLGPAVRIIAVDERPRRGGAVQVVGDPRGLVARRYDGRPGTFYLFRPDQHVTGRWRRPEPAAVRAALEQALGGPGHAGRRRA